MISEKKFNKFYQKFNDTFPNVILSIVDDVVFLDGELETYDEIIDAGFLASKLKATGVVNRIALIKYHEPPMKVPPFADKSLEGNSYDVLIIGGGITGTAIARELSKYKLNTLLVDKESDVGLHASSRNDGVLHLGIDLKTNTEKFKYLRAGVSLYPQLCQELGVPYNNMGQLITFSKKWMRHFMFLLSHKAKSRGLNGMEIWDKQRLLQEEPNVGENVEFAAFFPEGATICPYETVIALAENAIENGVHISLDTAVLGMDVADKKITKVMTTRGVIYPRIIINAAGTFADKIAAMGQDQFYSIHPRKGIEAILDKKARERSSSRAISMYRGSADRRKDHSKGGGIIPTVDGNVLIGPTAEETPDRENFATDSASIEELFARHHDTLPKLQQSDVITYFAGIRAATYEEDFIVRVGKWTKNIIHVAGIQSPGLTAALGIALAVSGLVQKLSEFPLPLNPNFNPIRQVKPSLKKLPIEERHSLITLNPDYGQIICRCEEISLGEIKDCLKRPLVVPSLDGIKRRIRPGMGRCQGGFCGPLITKIIHEEMNLPYQDINKKGHRPLILKGIKDDTYGNI
ncbi:MAG TPA: FAD/NAD(P)-binding oxidoreductase [Firmicutes bacterium]|jgi:glycerol-3-phosphate dehydrogenase|nr:FAD/NAD(P)-binding oxidoreductase [Bacillota bacterium]